MARKCRGKSAYIKFYMCMLRKYPRCPVTCVAKYAGRMWRQMNACQKAKFFADDSGHCCPDPCANPCCPQRSPCPAGQRTKRQCAKSSGYIRFYMCMLRRYPRCPVTSVAKYAGRCWRRMTTCQKEKFLTNTRNVPASGRDCGRRGTCGRCGGGGGGGAKMSCARKPRAKSRCRRRSRKRGRRCRTKTAVCGERTAEKSRYRSGRARKVAVKGRRVCKRGPTKRARRSGHRDKGARRGPGRPRRYRKREESRRGKREKNQGGKTKGNDGEEQKRGRSECETDEKKTNGGGRRRKKDKKDKEKSQPCSGDEANQGNHLGSGDEAKSTGGGSTGSGANSRSSHKSRQ